MATQMNPAQSQNSDKLPSQAVQNPKNVSAITLRSGNQIQVPPPVATPAPEPVKLHSTPAKENEIVAQKRKLPQKIFMQVDLLLVILTYSILQTLFHSHLEQFQTKKWKKWKRRSWRPSGK